MSSNICRAATGQRRTSSVDVILTFPSGGILLHPHFPFPHHCEWGGRTPPQYLTKNIVRILFFGWDNLGHFLCTFSSFSRKMLLKKLKTPAGFKLRSSDDRSLCLGYKSGLQDGSRRRNHGAMAATIRGYCYCLKILLIAKALGGEHVAYQTTLAVTISKYI